jgi:hypothetical protein
MTIKISKLDRPVHAGDWHDKPLRWEVTSDAPWVHRQLMTTRKQARQWASCLRMAGTWVGATNLFLSLP